MSKRVNRSATILFVCYILFVWMYRSLPFILLPEASHLDDSAIEGIRETVMLLFAIGVIIVGAAGGKWVSAAILFLIMLTVVYDEMLMPLVHNRRASAYMLPNLMVLSWGFSMLYAVLRERWERQRVSGVRSITLAMLIFLAQSFNFIILAIFGGPR